MRFVVALLLSGCIIHASENVRPTNPVESVFRIEVYKNAVLQGKATAFAAKRAGETTIIVTNRHVCLDNEANYVLVDANLGRHPATFYTNHFLADLCLLRTDYIFPVVVLDAPKIGEHIFSIGAPHEAFPIYQHGIIGEPVLINSTINGQHYFFPAQAVHLSVEDGSSGSPVFNSSKHVVGVVFGTDAPGHSFIIPSTVVSRFLAHN